MGRTSHFDGGDVILSHGARMGLNGLQSGWKSHFCMMLRVSRASNQPFYRDMIMAYPFANSGIYQIWGLNMLYPKSGLMVDHHFPIRIASWEYIRFSNNPRLFQVMRDQKSSSKLNSSLLIRDKTGEREGPICRNTHMRNEQISHYTREVMQQAKCTSCRGSCQHWFGMIETWRST